MCRLVIRYLVETAKLSSIGEEYLVKLLLKFGKVLRDGMKYFRRNGVDVVVLIFALAILRRLVQLKELPDESSHNQLERVAHIMIETWQGFDLLINYLNLNARHVQNNERNLTT